LRLSLRIGQLYLEKYHPQPCPLRLLLPPYRRGQEGGAQAAPAPAFRDDERRFDVLWAFVAA